MLHRKPSEYFRRHRSSAQIVDEARGVPFKYISFILGMIYLVIGCRDIFFCNVLLTNNPKEVEMMSVYGDCKNEPLKQAVMGLVGVCNIMQAILRIHVATTKKVANLYHAMILLVVADAGYNFVFVRAQGLSDYPLLYVGAVLSSMVYESFVLYVARLAYLARLKMIKIDPKVSAEQSKKD